MRKWMRGLALILLGATAAYAENIKGPEAKKLVAAGALLLDVRTVEEFKEKHIEGAKNIPVEELDKHLAEVGDKARTVVVYCRSGRRSEKAKGILLGAGWKKVENLGPMDAWDAK